MKLGIALKYIRIFHGMSIRDVTEAINLSSTGHISGLENGKKEVNLNMIKRYSEFFGIPSYDIIKIAESLEHPLPRIIEDNEKAEVIMSWIGLMP